MPGELTKQQWAIIAAGRKAMRDTIATAAPDDAVPLVAVAIAGAFADMVTELAVTGHAADLLATLNRQLASAGYELVAVRRQ